MRWSDDAGALRAELGYATALDAIDDPRGCTVRCTPTRRTRMLRLDETVFCKLRTRAPNAARVEWKAAERLGALGVCAPRPVFLARAGRASVVGVRAVPGRPAASWIVDELRAGRHAAVAEWARARVAPVVRRLHDAGLCFRDLYWTHVFVADADEEPALIDVERVFAPRRRWRRWWIKDVAGLVSSWPAEHGAELLEGMLDELGVDRGGREEVFARAGRVRGRVPRYGG